MPIPLRHRIAAAALLATLAVSLAAAGRLAAVARPAAAQSAQNRAGLVIQYAGGNLAARCVAFDEQDINGYDLLRRSGLPIVVESGGLGVTVCKIDRVGCDAPAQSCFCECQDLGATCTYWIYFTQVKGAWRYAALGALGQKVVNGSVHGWMWGNGNARGADNAPPALTFDQICNAGAPAATATPAPTTPPAAATTAPAAPSPTATAAPQQAAATPTPPPASAVAATPGGTVAFVVIAVALVVGLVVVQRLSKGGDRT